MSGSERDEGERPKLSWSEIDKRRDRPRTRADREQRPRGAAAEARARGATQQYLKQKGGALFAKHGAGGRGEALAAGVRDAQGTAGFADACRAYLRELGPPREASLCSRFLDARDPELVLAGLRGLEALRGEGALPAPGAGLRAQLRMLADDANDEVASTAETLLAAL
jgi:hypothetical protein